MNKTGHISCQIKNQTLQDRFRAAVAKMGIPESEFIRLSLRNTIQIVERENSMPRIEEVEA